MISILLKENTKQLHDLVEAKFNSHRIFDGTFAMDDYKNLIQYNYLFLLNYENTVFSAISHENSKEIHLEQRRKLALIEKDLEFLKIGTSSVQLPAVIKNEAEAFGILYVMEGATLGGNMIAKQLSRKPDFQEVTFRYFRCYDDKTGSYWKNFKEVMDRQITQEFHADCISGAKKAYGFLLDLSL